MTNEERNQLIQEVYHQPSEAISLIGVEELMAVIKKHATIEDDKSLKKELQLLLTRREVNPAYSATLGEERKPVALIDMLNPQYILTNIKVRSWEEAFYLAATPLIKDQVISRGYIDTIIQNVRKEGPFFIIMDQVALPHARPEEGALKLGLGITVLQEPVIINKKRRLNTSSPSQQLITANIYLPLPSSSLCWNRKVFSTYSNKKPILNKSLTGSHLFS